MGEENKTTVIIEKNLAEALLGYLVNTRPMAEVEQFVNALRYQIANQPAQ
jgi:hypothetical protein